MQSTTTTASETIRTSREVLPVQPAEETKDGEKHGETHLSSSTTISSPTGTLNDSRSSADIPSDLLGGDEGAINLQASNELQTLTTPNIVHGHRVPSGWACKYDAATDEYSFEYAESGAGADRTRESVAGQSLPQVTPSTRERRTPTCDETAQTSRRPTLQLFECQYGYHFPTSPTSSMISELARQVNKSAQAGTAKQPTAPKTRQIGYGKHKLVVPSEEEEQTRRLREMFPTAPAPIIEQMIRIYHGREGLIKAALISLGYKRSSEYNVQQATAQSPIMLMMSKASSKKLFDKLVGYFPDKDETLIKNLMYKHKEVEHEIISALVESDQKSSALGRHTLSQLDSEVRADHNGAIMKLRYLKFLYPTCEEIELYHLLNCNDLNAQVVMELVEKRGHKRVNVEEVMQNRKSQVQQMRAQQAAHAAQDKATSSSIDLVRAHVERQKPKVSEARIASLKANIKSSLTDLDENLIIGALEATDYNESLARKFLQEMAPTDDALFKQRYRIPQQEKPDVVAFPCKATQKGDTSFMSIISNETIVIPRDVVECQHALALLKVDASTFTQEDFARQKFTHRLGCQLGLALGSTLKRQPLNVRDSTNRGPNSVLRLGSKYSQICQNLDRSKPNCKATGHKESHRHGRNSMLQCGHNAHLLRRTHPFFDATIKG